LTSQGNRLLHPWRLSRNTRTDSAHGGIWKVSMTINDPSTSKELDTPAPLPPPAPSLAWSAPPPSSKPADAEIEPLRSARRNATSAFERKYLEAVLSRAQGSIARAAALSKVSRQMLQKLMRKHGVSMPR
jgi:DNA-binding NtrC family response regulator